MIIGRENRHLSHHLPGIGACALALLLVVSCAPQAKTYTLTLGGKTLTIEIADTPAERARGLMFRKSMPEDHGMLFIFPYDQQLAFWMKNTLIPLSVAYISADGEIREIYHMSPESLEAIQSDHSVRYALEANQGLFARWGVKPGDSVTLPPGLPKASE